MDKNIIFYAPMGTGVPMHMIGGGERGCRRTKEILSSAGYQVIVIDKPVMGNGAKNYIIMTIKAYWELLKSLIRNKDAIVYVVGFYEKNVYFEWLNLFTSKLFGHKTIYETRNGRLVKAYSEHGKVYKFFMDSTLKKADLIFAQGLEYVDFIKKKYGKEAVYTPNYVMNRSLKQYVGDRPIDVINLLYFGRVSKSKNIDVILKTAAELEKRGYKTKTTIIGGYTKDYKRTLDKLLEELCLSTNSIRFLGQQNFEVISNELQKAHFFVFPSQEKMEGHSNSLTEAMTFGVVPVVSTAGFNASIVNKSELVVRNIDPTKYADVINRIIQDDQWQNLSEFVYKRIKNNFTENQVKGRILAAIFGMK